MEPRSKRVASVGRDPVATSLHQQLKAAYAERLGGEEEVAYGDYRVDVSYPGGVVEIQHASLASIRGKTEELLENKDVVIVKPLVFRRRLIKYAEKNGPLESRRMSPKRGTWLDAFHDLIYFRDVFPHPRLTIELPAVEIDEHRYPKKKHRFRKANYHIADQVLANLIETRVLETGADVLALLPTTLPEKFDTGDLAEKWGVSRWLCQRITYFLRETEMIQTVGKRGRSMLYRPAA